MPMDTPDLHQEDVLEHEDVREPQGNRFSVEQTIATIWGERRRIFVTSFLAALVALGVGFLLPLYYKSTAVLLPETDKGKLGALNQIAGLASLAGVNVPGGADISRLYPAILTSETVLRGVIEREYITQRFSTPVNLISYFEFDEPTPAENFDKALKELRGLMSASLENKTGIVTATVEMREPQLAADVLNAVIEETDRFMRLKKTTNASEQLKWIEERMQQVEAELRKAEEGLKNFRERNRRVGDSPQLLLEQERLLRDVTVKSTVFVELKKQAELAKIEEIKNITIVNVLDRASLPIKKERPRRGRNALIVFLAALVAWVAYITVRLQYGVYITALWGQLKGHRTAPIFRGE